MRAATIWLVLIVVLIGRGGVDASGQPSAAADEGFLTLIPTALQELDELRVNTGVKAMQRDGTRNVVYVMKTPSEGNTYLNFHVDLASAAGPFVLHTKEICLKEDSAMGGADPEKTAPACYTPFDWFIDTGRAEVRADSLTVDGMAVVQFTIEVPRAELDDLTLFVRSQRVGTVKEIRARIAEKGENQ